MMPPLFACMMAKTFSLQALLRLQPELQPAALVVMGGDPPLEQVCSLNRKAIELGVTRGMTRLEMEVFPTVAVLLRSMAQEDSARTALLECAGNFSPRVEDQSTDDCFLCVIDIAGTEALFGSPKDLCDRLLRLTRSLNVHSAIAVSSNFHSAICVARSLPAGCIRVVPEGKESAALAPLPLSVINLSPEFIDTFSMWGTSSLGELAAMNETELVKRLGQQGKQVRLLARGEAAHLFRPVEPTFTLAEQMELDSPVELLDSLLFIIGVLLDQIVTRALSRILALAAVTLTLKLDGGASFTRVVRPALPSLDRKLWLKLIHLDLQANPPQAAVLGTRLQAEAGTTSKVQMGLFSPQVPEAMRLDVTLARIRNLVGEDCVGQAVLEDTHRPDAFHVKPFVVPSVTQKPLPDQPEMSAHRIAVRQLRPAEVVSVTLRNQQPESFVFRAKRYSVTKSFGPWSSSGDWWKPNLWSVEQWDVIAQCKDGAEDGSSAAKWLCCCLTRDLNQPEDHERWLVEALYD